MGYKVAVIEGTGEQAHEEAARIRAALEKAGHGVESLAYGEELARALDAARVDACWVCAGTPDEARAARQLAELLGIALVGVGADRAADVLDRARVARVCARQAALGGLDAGALATVRIGAQCVEDLGAHAVLERAAARMPGGFPLAVRPARDLGAGDAAKVDGAEELAAAVRSVVAAGDEALVQEWVDGVQMAVVVLGDEDDLQVLPPVEFGCGTHGAAWHVPVRPTSLSLDDVEAEAIRSEIERAAIDTYLACGLLDLGCVYLVWDGAQARVLGVNPAPSLADGSVADRALAAAAIGIADVVDALVLAAVARGPQ